jgi:hypothetical protein
MINLMSRRIVILYGQSMLLSLIAASLAENDELHILQVDTWDEIRTYSGACLPDTLIFDLDVASINHIMTLLFLNPYMQFIGLDVETNRALLIAGKETRSLTLNKVKDLIMTH